MEKETLRSKAERALTDSYEYYRDRAKQEKKMMSERRKRMKIHDIVDGLLVFADGLMFTESNHSRITLHFDNTDNSRDFMSRLIDRFGIDKVDKTFHTYSKEVRWYYSFYINHGGYEIDMTVFPAEPSPDCTPKQIQEVSYSHKWVCEQTGKEL